MNKHDIHNAPGRNYITEIRINFYSKIKKKPYFELHSICLPTIASNSIKNKPLNAIHDEYQTPVSASECDPQGVQSTNPGSVCRTCVPLFWWTP